VDRDLSHGPGGVRVSASGIAVLTTRRLVGQAGAIFRFPTAGPWLYQPAPGIAVVLRGGTISRLGALAASEFCHVHQNRQVRPQIVGPADQVGVQDSHHSGRTRHSLDPLARSTLHPGSLQIVVPNSAAPERQSNPNRLHRLFDLGIRPPPPSEFGVEHDSGRFLVTAMIEEEVNATTIAKSGPARYVQMPTDGVQPVDMRPRKRTMLRWGGSLKRQGREGGAGSGRWRRPRG